MGDLDKLRKDLRSFQRPGKAKILQRFFKTGKGEYGEGDEFLGLMTDETRSVAKKYLSLSFSDISKLLASKVHEERIVAVMILNQRFKKADLQEKKKIYDFYFAPANIPPPAGMKQVRKKHLSPAAEKLHFENISGINNWDLVDGSAPNIVGGYLYLSKSPRNILYELAKSNDLWKKRIGVMACFYFIKEKDFSDSLKIAEILLQDKEDLIQKVVGWMLREIGNRDICVEEEFLMKFCKQMPRTMLRYAIEKFPENKRQKYLKGKV